MSQIVVLHDDAVIIGQEGQDALLLSSHAISRKDVKEFLREAREQFKRAEDHRIISRYLWPCVLVEAILSRDADPSFSVADVVTIVPVTDEDGNQVVLDVDGQNLRVRCIPYSGLVQIIRSKSLGRAVMSAVPENVRDGLRVEFGLEEDGFGLTLLFGKGADAYAPQGLSRLVSVSMRGGHITTKIGDLGFEEAFLLVACHPDEEGFVLYFAPQAEIMDWTPSQGE